MANGIRALTGVPVFEYFTWNIWYDYQLQEAFDRLKQGEQMGYIMGISTGGSGDQFRNDCGIAERHAYSVISAFEMIDANYQWHQMLLVRNPWGERGYNKAWRYNDPAWTDELVAQIPHGFDPRQPPTATGLFVVPIYLLKYGYCFS